MSPHDPITEADLHAYVDGRLDNTRRTVVEAYLADNPQAAERVQDYRKLNESLHALYDPALQEPVPPHLMPANRARRFTIPLQAAASVLLLLLGSVTGWVLRDATIDTPLSATSLTTLPRLAASAYAVYAPEVRHPVEVTAADEKHLIAWLSKRLGTDVRAPALDQFGYHLVGGRLLAADSRPAALFMYENATGNRVTLLVRTGIDANRETAFRYAEEGDVRVFYWVDGAAGYALSSEADKNETLQVAHEVYRQLTALH